MKKIVKTFVRFLSEKCPIFVRFPIGNWAGNPTLSFCLVFVRDCVGDKVLKGQRTLFGKVFLAWSPTPFLTNLNFYWKNEFLGPWTAIFSPQISHNLPLFRKNLMFLKIPTHWCSLYTQIDYCTLEQYLKSSFFPPRGGF